MSEENKKCEKLDECEVCSSNITSPKDFEFTDFTFKDFSVDDVDLSNPVIKEIQDYLDKFIIDQGNLDPSKIQGFPIELLTIGHRVTEGTIEHSGTLDYTLATLNSYLKHFIDNGNIGADEAVPAFIQLFPAALQSSVQYAVEHFNSKLRARESAVNTYNALIQAKTAEANLKLMKLQAEKATAELALAKEQIVQIRYQNEQSKAQIAVAKTQIEMQKAQLSLLVEQLASQKAQTRVTLAQICDEVDGVPIKGVVGAQKELSKEQTLAFERDAFHKFYTTAVQVYTTSKATDPGIMLPAFGTAYGVQRLTEVYAKSYFGDRSFTDKGVKASELSLDQIQNNIKNNIEMTAPFTWSYMTPPDDYKNYYSEEDMSGESATKSAK